MTESVQPASRGAAYLEQRKTGFAPLDQLLQSGRPEDCRRVLEQHFEEIGYDQLNSAMMRQYVVMDLCLSAELFAGKLGVSNEEFAARFGTADEVMVKLRSTADALDFLTEVLTRTVLWRMERFSDPKSALIDKAKEYIGRHYNAEGFCLSSTAAAVSLSPSYFSALFRKHTGVNFVDYVNTVRIDKAKELLCCTLMRIAEVADAVGYRDYRYFSLIFKKYVGQPPREYQRKSNQ